MGIDPLEVAVPIEMERMMKDRVYQMKDGDWGCRRGMLLPAFYHLHFIGPTHNNG